MKNFLLPVFSLFFLLTATLGFAQTNEQCASHLRHDHLMQSDPNYAQQIQINEAHIQSVIQNQLNNNGSQLSTTGVLTLPVVVHVIHTGQAVGVGANISAAQIQSGIDMLNDRFRKTPGTHGDAGGVDTEIEFCLATRDPNCNATSGIVRVNGSSVTDYAAEGITAGQGSGADEIDVKNLSRWPNTDYINIWVVTEIEDNNGGFGIQGYAYFPGASSAVDGVVILHTAMGNIGTVNSFNNLGRTLTHEMGHLLNLYHTFEGDNGGTQCPTLTNGCGSGDGDCISDTDPHIRSSSNCPTTSTNTCTGVMLGSVVNNYMDYSSQNCADEFTAGQKTRMRAAACGPRAGLLTSLGCTPVTLSPPVSACVPTTTDLNNNFGMGIRNVDFADFDVTSGSSINDGGYLDLSCTQLSTLQPSTLYPIDIETNGTNNHDVRVYIDYNGNGVLTDAGELVFSSNANTVHSGTLTTPASPVTGTFLRMRVVADFMNNTISGPCYNAQYGQSEDYSVIFPALTAPVSLSTTTTDVSCNGLTDGSIDLTVGGGTTPYTYQWSNGPTTEDINGLGAGAYTVTVTDAGGQTAITSAVITEPTAIVATATVSQAINCFGTTGCLMIGATGGISPYTFVWSTGATGMNICGLLAGTYTVTVTDANGCTSSSAVTLTQPTIMAASSIDVNVSTIGGSDGSIDLTVSGGTPSYTYFWSNGSNSQDLTNISAGTYTVTISDINGCTITYSTTITQPSSGPLSVSLSPTNVTCSGAGDGIMTANVTGGTTPYTYLWSNGGTTATITGLTPANYTVTVTDATGSTQTATTSISQPFPLSVNTVSINQVSCFGAADGSITVSGVGGLAPYTFAWSSGQTTASITGLNGGSYTVTITDVNGCTGTSVYGINQPSQINITNTSTNVTVNGGNDGTIDITVTGGFPSYTYSWSNGTSTEDQNNLTAGTYTVTVTDQNGCTGTTSVVISQPGSGINITTSTVDVTCAGQATGSINTTVSNGTMPYTFSWSNAATTQNLTGLVAGTYTVTVTDQTGTTGTATATVTEPQPLVANTVAVDVTCNGANDGSVTATVTGGVTPYFYIWNTGQSTPSITGLGSGTYSVTVTDANGCTTTKFGIVNEPTALNVIVTAIDVSCGGTNDGSANGFATGGTAPYTYVWSSGQTTSNISNLAPGTYTLTATDANGCTATGSGTVNQTTGLTLNLTSTDISCNGAADGSITSNVSGGNAPYTYVWSNGMSMANLTNLSAGTYTLTVSDALGCSSSGSATITEPTAMSATSTVTDATCNGNADGAISLTVSGGVGPYNYSWNQGATTANLTGITSGTYTCTITDANGCQLTVTETVSELLPIQAFIIPQGPTNLCPGQSVVLEANIGIGITYQWYLNGNPIPGATSITYTATQAGSYVVEVTDGLTQCVGTSLPEVVTVVQLNVSFSGLSGDYCQGDGSVSLSGSPTGGVFSGDGVSGSTFDPGAAGAGVATITYTYSDPTGCVDSSSQTTLVSPGPNIGSVNGLTVVQPNQTYFYNITSVNGTSYTWTVTGGTLLSSANNLASVQWGAGPLGELMIVGTDLSGCTDTLIEPVYIGIVSVGENNPLAGIDVFPNPAHSQLQVRVQTYAPADYELRLLSVSGQLVYSVNWNQVGPSQTMSLPVEEFSAGVYVLQVLSGAAIEQRKVVIH